MPIMASRKDAGLIRSKFPGVNPACVQLRQDNRAGSLYNLVGFQTRLRIRQAARVLFA